MANVRLNDVELVKKIILAPAIELIDPKSYSVASSIYEKVTDSTDLSYDSRVGSANLIIALNMLKMSHIRSDWPDVINLFKDILNMLVDQKLIRIVPKFKREQFKVVK